MMRQVSICGSLVFLASALLIGGCHSAPELTPENARALLQANYDQQAEAGAVILVEQNGLKQGLAAKFWKLTKIYPNNRWADYTLTDDGKKVFVLNGGGDVIEWRPDADGKAHFYITSVATYHPRVRDVHQPEADVVANVAKAQSASFTESVNLESLPQALQDMAHNPGNTLSSKRNADFSLEGGVWKVHSVQ